MTKIQWTDVSDNPIRLVTGGHWCQKISGGCQNCYAEAINNSDRFAFASHLPYTGEPPARWRSEMIMTGKSHQLFLDEKILKSWQTAKKPKKHFVCSMTDWCGDWVPEQWRWRMLDAMAASPNQIFQLLTKRSHILEDTISKWLHTEQLERVPNNIWLGVSIEAQNLGYRLTELTQIEANRFLSVEPLLGEIDFSNDLALVDWVIVGGESGDKARPCELNWIRKVLEQCNDHWVPCFVKQLGTRVDDSGVPVFLKDKKGGNPDEWTEDLRIREFPREMVKE